jgi:hypothetical protein
MVPGYGVLVDTTGSQINQLEAFNAQTLASEGAATPVGAISTNAAFWAQTGHLVLAPDGATLYAASGATNSVDSFKLPARSAGHGAPRPDRPPRAPICARSRR